VAYYNHRHRRGYTEPIFSIGLLDGETVMYACFGLIHLPHNESTRSETPHQLSQCKLRPMSTESTGVRLHVNWVNTEGTIIYENFIIPIDSVDVESHSALTQLTCSLTSWQEMRLCINWVTTECQKIWISRGIQEQNQKHSKDLFFGMYMFDQYKNQNKKTSCKCTFKWWSIDWYHFVTAVKSHETLLLFIL
jgi:hypothetical protein